jgi:hypothetical protein
MVVFVFVAVTKTFWNKKAALITHKGHLVTGE